MHWIACHILKVLAFSDAARYSELRPDAIEGNLFQYHARKLERAGLILREHDGYRLSPKGRRAVADMNLVRNMAQAATPRVVVMVYAHRPDGKVLFFRWRRHPYRGLVSLPFGRLTYGKTAPAMAEEQLFYKSGYRAEFCYLGTLNIRFTREAHTLDHLTILAFKAKDLHGEHGSDRLTGESFWSDPGDPGIDLLPGTPQTLSWIEDPRRPGFLELEV